MSESASAGELATILQDYIPRAEYEQALDALNTLESERNTHRDELAKYKPRAEQLERKLRERSARDAFNAVADKLKIDPKFRDDVFQLGKFEVEGDEPDVKAMEKHFATFMDGKDHYKQTDAPKPKTIPAGEGAQRGQSTSPGVPRYQATRQQMRDAVWMRDHQKEVTEARRAGVFELIDQ